MAEEKACPLPSFTPQEVAGAFVNQYYFMLRDSPAELHKFYEDSSTVSRMGSDGAMTSFITMEEIKKQVLSSLDCKDYDILSFDAQLTANEGVFVVVVGCFITKNDKKCKFSQSFFLAPMEKVDGYFVLNDILRFLDEQETKTIRTEDVPTAFSTPTQDDASTNDVPEEVPPKKTFLSVVNALNENNSPFKAPPVKKPVRTAAQESNLENKGGLERKKKPRNEGNVRGTYIFVGNLAMDSNPEELYEAFKSFGPIKRNGVHIRSDKKNRRFAFIQFESSASAQSAVQASFIRIGNRKLNIEEKKRKDFDNRKFSQESTNGNGNGQDSFRGGRNFPRRNGPAN